MRLSGHLSQFPNFKFNQKPLINDPDFWQNYRCLLSKYTIDYVERFAIHFEL